MAQQRLARIAALFYLLNFVLGTLALVWLKQGRAADADLMTLLAAADYALVVLMLGKLFEPAGAGLSWLVAAIGLAAARCRRSLRSTSAIRRSTRSRCSASTASASACWSSVGACFRRGPGRC
jgi:hypothetical protein